jgi:hypothetical protein
MSDTQLPDFSDLEGPANLPAPRPLTRSRGEEADNTEAVLAHKLGKPLSGPGAIPRKHLASLEDSLKEERKESQSRAQIEADKTRPPAPLGSRDDTSHLEQQPFAGSSFRSPQEIDELIHTAQNPSPPTSTPSVQTPPMTSSTQAPSLVSASPQQRRSIRELFTTGVLKKTIRVAGFDLTFKTVNQEEYSRAMAMACTFPEGVARDVALRQYILAFACTHINDEPVENHCIKPEIIDPISRRSEVFARLDSELVKRMFEQGYVAVRQESSDLLDKVAKEAGDIGNFTPPTR